jgi:hypothetical protein
MTNGVVFSKGNKLDIHYQNPAMPAGFFLNIYHKKYQKAQVSAYFSSKLKIS